MTQQALGSKGILFDAPKFNWIGSMSKGTPVCAIMGFTDAKKSKLDIFYTSGEEIEKLVDEGFGDIPGGEGKTHRPDRIQEKIMAWNI